MKLKSITIFDQILGQLRTYTRKEWIEYCDKQMLEGERIEIIKIEY